MFVTRLFRRTAWIHVLLLVVAKWAMGPAAKAASPTADQWRSAGVRSSTATETGSASDGAWRLPNGQVAPPNGRVDNSSPREPRKLSAPGDAKPLASTRGASSVNQTATVQKHSPSAAVQQTAAVIPAKRPAHQTMRSGTQPIGIPRVARAIPPSRGKLNPNTARMRQRMNVASNEPDWTGGSEDLPLPGTANKPTVEGADPFGSDSDGHYIDGNQPYMPGMSGGPGHCEDGCCEEGYHGDCYCGEGCCCGGCGEPSCACECADDECCQACVNDCCSIGPGDVESCNSIRIRVPRWQELQISGGVQGFKNPYDKDRDRGNFGFHESFNIGAKVPYTYVGYQVGYLAAQSQLNGTENPSPGSPESHTQHFTTFGMYRRTKDGPQFGSAWDVLVDRRHNTRTFHQIRNEISWLDRCTHEFGFSATIGIMDHEETDEDILEELGADVTWEAADQYLLFYRLHGKRGGEGRFYAGFSDDSDGILGADMQLPVHDRWSVQTGFTYMIPDARDGVDGSREEAWNLSIALVWHWGCTARKCHDNPYRPLFNVANNGYMIIDSR
jgi:hypothetical protein